MRKKIHEISVTESNQVSGGMCNCIMESDAYTGTGSGLGSIASVGPVASTNVCKDLVSNISAAGVTTSWGVSWKVKYVGCFPQDDMEMHSYMKR